MPRVKWGVDAGDVDDFDRDSQFKPYAGPVPPDGVYAWTLKVLQHVAGSKQKNPQLRVGLELVPRAEFDEDKYRGYFIMDFIPVMPTTTFRYVPLLDALGVSGTDFANRTTTDEDGNIVSIGKWRNSKDTVVIAQLISGTDQNGNARKEIRGGTYGELGEDIELSDSDDVELPDDDDLDADAVTDDYDDDEEDRGPKRVRRGRTATATRTASRTKRTSGRSTGTTRKVVRKKRKRDADFDDEVGF